MMFGEELDELGWERNEEYNADVLVEYTDGQSQGDFGYLKLVNDQIKTLNEVMDNYVELTEEEKQKKKQRMEEIRKMYKQMTPTSDPEDYYAYPRQSSFYPEE
jgi:hemerythrin superfamily protein